MTDTPAPATQEQQRRWRRRLTWLSLATLVVVLPSSNDALMAPRRDRQRLQRRGSVHNSHSGSRRSSATNLEHDGTSTTRRRSLRMLSRTASDDLVVDPLPLLDEPFSTLHYAGYIHLPNHSNGNEDEKIDESNGDDKERNLFYWLFAPGNHRNDTNTTSGAGNNGGSDGDSDIPLVIWLNGGPGYSSLAGLFLENGPFRLHNKNKSEWTLKLNEHSWHNAPAWMLYVDQPVGTGLSYVSNDENDSRLCHDDECIAEDFYDFLIELLWLHRDVMLESSGDTTLDNNSDSSSLLQDKYVLKRELYITGESYAGHYIPVIAENILKRNQAFKNDRATDKKSYNQQHDMAINNEDNANNDDESLIMQLPQILIPITGIAIGNGFMDTRTQWNDADYLLSRGWISSSQKAALDVGYAGCERKMDDPDYEANPKDILGCFRAYDNVDITPDVSGWYCDYDGRIWLSKGEKYPPGRNELEAYIGGSNIKPLGLSKEDSKSILTAIHALKFVDEKQQYKVSSYQRVGQAMYGGNYDLKDVNDEVVHLLSSNIQVLFYNGVEDGMCDHFGNERFLDHLPWERKSEWSSAANRYIWIAETLEGKHVGKSHGSHRPRGFAKELDNLIFLKVLDAGHLLPMDQPEVALDMIRTFMGGHGFGVKGPKQNLDQLDPEEVEAYSCGSCGGIHGKSNQEELSNIAIDEEEDEEEHASTNNEANASEDASVKHSRLFFANNDILSGIILAVISCALLSFAFLAGSRSSSYGRIVQSDRDHLGDISLSNTGII